MTLAPTSACPGHRIRFVHEPRLFDREHHDPPHGLVGVSEVPARAARGYLSHTVPGELRLGGAEATRGPRRARVSVARRPPKPRPWREKRDALWSDGERRLPVPPTRGRGSLALPRAKDRRWLVRPRAGGPLHRRETAWDACADRGSRARLTSSPRSATRASTRSSGARWPRSQQAVAEPILLAYLAPSVLRRRADAEKTVDHFFSLDAFAEQEFGRIPPEHQALWPYVRDLLRSMRNA